MTDKHTELITNTAEKAKEFMKYRKKPIVIEAIKWDGRMETLAKIQKLNTLNRDLSIEEDFIEVDKKSLMIDTLEGVHEGKIGDWIIQGVSGELYPCKPDIFEMTYEKVED